MVFPLMTQVNGIVKLDKDARVYFKEFEEVEFMLVHGVVVSSYPLLGMMKFVVFLTPGTFPVEVFMDRDRALNWMQKEVKKRELTWPTQKQLLSLVQ